MKLNKIALVSGLVVSGIVVSNVVSSAQAVNIAYTITDTTGRLLNATAIPATVGFQFTVN